MQLDAITVHNFKNIAQATMEFSPKINGLLGNNGMGKSNLLDAIHFMSFCKSFAGVTDAMVIRQGEDFAMVRALYTRRDAPEELTLGMARGRRKSLKRGGKGTDASASISALSRSSWLRHGTPSSCAVRAKSAANGWTW